jgi:hypothetical protein
VIEGIAEACLSLRSRLGGRGSGYGHRRRDSTAGSLRRTHSHRGHPEIRECPEGLASPMEKFIFLDIADGYDYDLGIHFDAELRFVTSDIFAANK